MVCMAGWRDIRHNCRMTVRLIASIGVACAALALAAASPYKVKLNASRCKQASPRDLTSLGLEWLALEPYGPGALTVMRPESRRCRRTGWIL